MVNGVVIVRKEKGMTSFGVVARMRRIFGQKKIGHTGTLDPDAEGVLPVCLGKATRLVEELSRGTKTYRAVLILGIRTDTQDLSGTVLSRSAVSVTEQQAEAAVLSFRGRQMQMPPMYSALKVNGRKLVDLARKGIEVERKPREVEFSDFRILATELPRITFEVTCSHGAYIRTLCSDIGDRLGCGGCMESLLRTRVETFDLADALTLGEIEEKTARGETDFILPPEYFYRDLPAAEVRDSALKATLNGRPVSGTDLFFPDGVTAPERIRLFTADGTFIGVSRKEGRLYRIEKYYMETD